MNRKKLSSDKTYFVKKGLPVAALLLFAGFTTYIIIDDFYILVPVLLFFAVGLIITFVRNRKIVDCYVNYDSSEIIIDNLGGKILRYQFSDLVSARHKRSKNEVRLKFCDGKSFIFVSRNMWKSSVLEEWDNVDVDLNKVLENRFVKPIS